MTREKTAKAEINRLRKMWNSLTSYPGVIKAKQKKPPLKKGDHDFSKIGPGYSISSLGLSRDYSSA